MFCDIYYLVVIDVQTFRYSCMYMHIVSFFNLFVVVFKIFSIFIFECCIY